VTKLLFRSTLLLLIFISACTLTPKDLNIPLVTATPSITLTPTITPTPTPTPTPIPLIATLPLPQAGEYYLGVFPGGRTGEEDDIRRKDIRSFEDAVGKQAAWVYFSNNWYRDRAFPMQMAEDIRRAGSVPYIRLMLRSNLKFTGSEPLYTLQNIIAGYFDEDLRAWCQDARRFGSQLIVEYGTEVNSNSFAWSGIANGAGDLAGYGDPNLPDGPERFQEAYRHIIRICRAAGARNITWVFHADSEDYPREPWNRAENYYPGDEWIDWIGVSVYAAYRPSDAYWNDFRYEMDAIYARLGVLAPDKPFIVAEFGAPDNNPLGDQAEWALAALTDLTSGRYPKLIGFAWWNERWQNDDDPRNDTNMRVEDNPDLERVFGEWVGDNASVLETFFP
jgi:hypothetical protein